MANCNTWQSVSSGGICYRIYQTEHNIGSCYDTSNGKFTVPVTGLLFKSI